MDSWDAHSTRRVLGKVRDASQGKEQGGVSGNDEGNASVET